MKSAKMKSLQHLTRPSGHSKLSGSIAMDTSAGPWIWAAPRLSSGDVWSTLYLVGWGVRKRWISYSLWLILADFLLILVDFGWFVVDFGWFWLICGWFWLILADLWLIICSWFWLIFLDVWLISVWLMVNFGWFTADLWLIDWWLIYHFCGRYHQLLEYKRCWNVLDSWHQSILTIANWW